MKVLILKSLCYFDIFNHPLRKEELTKLCGIDEQELEILLKDLQNENHCFEYADHFSISSNIKELVEERKDKEIRAQAYLKKLPLYTKIIKSFPFVRSVSISGSLSKGVMHEKGDIDYFIITKRNRLWICRSLLILFKKIFLFNSRKYFCVNYFVDENNTEIIDKNVFTAIEVSHLVPVYGADLAQKMKENNAWLKDYVSTYQADYFFPPYEGNSSIKTFIERLFSGIFAEKIDLFLMKLTYRRWSKKFKNFDPEKLELTMRSNRGISKHHPSDYQTKVLLAYQERIKKFDIKNESPAY